ncbi:unnamed protein product [Euphydryas editha]|uniref:Uncharacterized protein n=1 Tax=Euphydryas editha TaxID=104508 RepID=A0AAU9UN18_EUPED|nr:unnamed protein product [Euphydryas editha]
MTKFRGKIIQLIKEDIKDFAACSKVLGYDRVPYRKVTALKFTQCYFSVYYKS